LIGYLVAFGLEILGMCLILWIGVPLFRELLEFQQIVTLGDEIVFLVAVLLIQFTYWNRLRHNPPFDLPIRPFPAHHVLIASRLSFIFASAVFSLVVYRYSDKYDFGLIRTPLMAAVLFSVFCFSRHLEKLGLLMLSGYRAPPSRQ
jgi:hypothetical protein